MKSKIRAFITILMVMTLASMLTACIHHHHHRPPPPPHKYHKPPKHHKPPRYYRSELMNVENLFAQVQHNQAVASIKHIDAA